MVHTLQMQLGEQLATIEHAARGLRAAGITKLIIDGDRVEIDLAPLESQQQTTVAVEQPSEPNLLDPLNDPDTYGGSIPQFNIGSDLATYGEAP